MCTRLPEAGGGGRETSVGLPGTQRFPRCKTFSVKTGKSQTNRDKLFSLPGDWAQQMKAERLFQ